MTRSAILGAGSGPVALTTASHGCGSQRLAQPLVVDLLEGDHLLARAAAGAEIARAAAIPPAIVVMQGMPRATAAERIS